MNLSKVIGIWLSIFVTIYVREITSSPMFQKVYKFLNDNSHHYVDVFYNSSSTKWLQFRPKDIPFATIPMKNMDKMHQTSFGVFIFDGRTDNLETFLKIIAGRKVRMSMLLFINIEDDKSYEELLRYFGKMRTPSYFYTARMALGSGRMLWHQVISLNSGPITNALTFPENSLKVIESFNLKGLEVTSTTLTWAPFYTIGHCNLVGLECATSYGYLEDYMDFLSKKFNFTYSSHKNLDNNWGVVPNKNGTYGGVLGDLFSKKYDMIISVWYWLIERDHFADHIPIVRNRDVLAMKVGKSRTDFSLFLRVFTNELWATILFVTLAISACLLLTKYCKSKKCKSCKSKNYTKSFSLIIFTLLVFFVIIRAYYGGALTKFFTVTVPEPFENKIDVMKSYPKYNLMIRKDQEAVYQYLMKKGDPVYKKFWKRLTENSEQTTYTSEKEGLEIIGADSKNVIVIDETIILGYLKANVNEQIPYLLAHGRWDYLNLMLHKNSPLTPMFKHGVGVLREKGFEHQLCLKWIGAGANTGGAILEAIVLTPGQVILIFSLMMVVYGVTLVLLCGEVVASKMRANFRNRCIPVPPAAPRIFRTRRRPHTLSA